MVDRDRSRDGVRELAVRAGGDRPAETPREAAPSGLRRDKAETETERQRERLKKRRPTQRETDRIQGGERDSRRRPRWRYGDDLESSS